MDRTWLSVAKRLCGSERACNRLLISFFQADNMKFFEATKCCICITDLDVAGYVIGGYMVLGVLNNMAYSPGYLNIIWRE